MEKHPLEYSSYSCKVSWCPICNQHFYNDRNKEHTTKATSEHYHIIIHNHMETPHFYNTTNLTGNDLQQAVDAATKQNDRVILIYKAKNRPMSPSQVLDVYNAWWPRCPITSIRRAITNLTIHGFLSHTGTLRPGPFGAKDGVWKLAE